MTERLPRPSALLGGTAVAVALAFATPLVYLVARNLGSVDVFGDQLLAESTLGPLRRSLGLATVVAASTSVLGTALAWLLTRSDLPGRRLFAVLGPLPLVFPSFVGAFALRYALVPGGLLGTTLGFDGVRFEGFAGAWVVLTLFTFPYVLLPVAARLQGLSPSLEESARLLGRRPVEVFTSVVLPQIARSIQAGALLVFLYVVSDFGAVQLLRYDTLTRAIYETRLLDRSRSLALALLLAVVALAVVVLERGAARRLPASASVRTREALRVPLGRWRWPAAAGVAAFIAAALVGPLISLGFWVWRGLDASADPLSRLGDDLASLGPVAWNTAWVSVATAVVAVVAVLPVAYLTSRYRSAASGPANALVVSGFALPGLVIALSVVFLVLQGPAPLAPLYNSFAVLIFAYVVHFGAQSMRAAQVAVASVPSRLDDAARMLGASRVRRFATIELPLMLPGLAAGAGLVLLSTMKELPATLLVAPRGFETLATRMWGQTEDGFLAQAGLASLALVTVSGLLTWLLVIRRSEKL